MSSSQPNPALELLLKEGIAAARAGDKTRARMLLEQVVSQDQRSEKGWFWLAAVVDSVDEKKVCLGNVIVVNPHNARAHTLLEQLEQRAPASGAASPLPTGSPASRRTSRRGVWGAVGLAALALLAIAAVIVLGVINQDKESTESTRPPVTNAAVVNTPRPAETESTAAGVSEQPPATQAGAVLPPTWTPVPTPTPIYTGPGTPLAPPPAELGGLLLLQSGLVVGDDKNQPIVVMSLDGSQTATVSTADERGHAPVFSPDGSQYVFVKYAPGTQDQILQTNDLEGSQPEALSVHWGRDPILARQDMPAWSPDGRWIAFSAVGPAKTTPDLYLLSMTGAPGTASNLERLTDDEAAESWPAFSPDSEFLVYAADLSAAGKPYTELRIFNPQGEPGQRITDLTTNHVALTEAAPDWSPDARWIVFEGREEGATESDIYWIQADGLTPAEKIIDSDANDIRPRFSPDGRSIVFSSDRAGNWDVFVYEIATGALFQVTTAPHTDIAGDWSQ